MIEMSKEIVRKQQRAYLKPLKNTRHQYNHRPRDMQDAHGLCPMEDMPEQEFIHKSCDELYIRRNCADMVNPKGACIRYVLRKSRIHSCGRECERTYIPFQVLVKMA